MAERGVKVDHSTINRWVLKYAPELDKRVRPHLQATNDSWRVDETYIEIRREWKYLYRAVDSEGNPLDFLLSAKRDGKAAARFFCKVLKAQHTQTPRIITVDKNAAYPVAMDELKEAQTLKAETELRQIKYLNNIIEQDPAILILAKSCSSPGNIGIVMTSERAKRARTVARTGVV